MHKYKFITILLATAACAVSCSTKTPDSFVSCDMTKNREFVIRWDIFPVMDGDVNIYISSDPTSFDTSKEPLAVAPISDNFAKISSPDSLSRFYFLLDFNGKFKRIVGTRGAYIKSAHVFRDLGGYKGDNDKRIKWGMIFRSGIIDTINDYDKERFARLGIKTIIDFRDECKTQCIHKDLGVKTMIHLPIKGLDDSKLKERILSGEFKRGDARIYMQDFYISLLDKSGQEEFESMFNILTQKENYPIVITSDFGKGHCDIASALILSALGVSEEFILEDYTWANQYFNSDCLKKKIAHLNPDVQEGVLTMLKNERKDMLCTFDVINRRYESMESFLKNEIGLTSEKSKKLHNILMTRE